MGRRDGEGQIRLADALTVAGAAPRAREIIATALAKHPDMPEILRAARALGLPLPLDPFRLDGRQVIRDFQASGHHYAAPAVVVLDRTVTRVFPSGAEMILTHEIVRVQSKDAIEKWGETSVPERTEILVLRTHKADGTTREPEEFAGKDTISAADLAVGDYVEKETIEVRPPRDAFAGHGTLDDAGGFIGDRFYFQSFDAPLDRSEYLVVTEADAAAKLRIDRRAGAPAPTRAAGAPAWVPPIEPSSPPSPRRGCHNCSPNGRRSPRLNTFPRSGFRWAWAGPLGHGSCANSCTGRFGRRRRCGGWPTRFARRRAGVPRRAPPRWWRGSVRTSRPMMICAIPRVSGSRAVAAIVSR